MPEHEDIERQLQAAREAKWVDNRIKKITRWPGKKRETLRDLIGPSRRLYDDEVFSNRIEKAQQYFKNLDDKQRQKLWTGLFPRLAPHLERAWLDAGERPYQFGYARFPFRAPHRAETIGESRAHFFVLACEALHGFDPNAEWLAAWAPHLDCDHRDPRIIGWILGSVLRGGGEDADAVRAVLVDSISGEHEIGQMGQHAVVAFLNSNDHEDWEIIGKLLIAAQRQEGLRQAILEAVDEASPDAFRYMLGLILEHDLGRFSATVRAFDVWLGMQWAGGSAKVVNAGVRRLAELFDDETEREKAVRQGDPEDASLALWVTAYEDAEQAIKLAAPLLEEPTPERRFVALRTIERLALFPESLELIASRIVLGAEDDPRLQRMSVDFLSRVEWVAVSDELFNATAGLFERLPAKKKKLDPIVWPWAQYTLDRRSVAAALQAMAMGSPEKLIPFAGALSSGGCVGVICELAGIGEFWSGGQRRERKRRKLTPKARQLMLDLVGDTRQNVQKAAFEAIATLRVEDDEVERLLGLLHRTAAALRAGAIGRLSKLSDGRAIEIISHLVSDNNSKRRAAGLELASHLVESNRSKKKVLNVIAEHRETLTEPELVEVADRLLGGEAEAVTLDDCLGLVPTGSRSALPQPKYVGVQLETDAAKAYLKELADLFLGHGETEIEVEREHSKQRVLLASAGWGFPTPKRDADPLEDAKERLPLADTWLAWLAERPTVCRDDDRLELVRAWAWTVRGNSYLGLLPAPFRKRHAWDIVNGFEHLVEWMLVLSGASGGGDLLVQHVEDSLAKASLSAEEKKDSKEERSYLYHRSSVAGRLGIVKRYLDRSRADITDECKKRLALLSMLALERGLPGCECGPSLDLFTAAYEAGVLNEADFLWLLLHPRKAEYRIWGSPLTFGPIREVTGLCQAKVLEGHSKLAEAAGRMRNRLVEVELTRGERLTPASLPAAELRHAGGADVLFKLIAALGRDKIVRQHEWGDPTRVFSFSRLMSVTSPGETDTLDRFAEIYEESGLKPARLLEVVMFAPQWAGHVQHALRMKGLEDAVWWIHAHTKQNAYWQGQEFRDLWAARISERTELEAEDMEEGAVDVAWFRRVIDVVGPDGWDQLQKPARYASNSGGHKRAQLFADAMLARVTTNELVTRIDEKRHQDSVRALGLVPLPSKRGEARAETLRRYQRLQEFKRESRKFGSQRQASEGRAVEIGMQNLARTAGYRDPRRFQWAMEAEAVADLARGPVSVTAEETTVSLAITPEGDPELTVVKKGRRLKSVPAKLRKQEQIAELRSRVTDLRRQRSRMRLSLEESMCRGDTFAGPELRGFFAHPMLRPMVERLVFIGNGDLIGYPDKEGRVLRNHAGSLEAIGKNDTMRLAHPIDFLKRRDWSAWQRECFSIERVQPFKQIFREVYPKTTSELDDCDFTRRYAGHQVNPRQALALLKRRQWIAAPEEGVRKTFHDEGLIAEVWFQEPFYTPAEIEDLTLEGVTFIRRGDQFKRLSIADIPDRLFSEAMRDLDLVVSVAHSGGVDPEASASTVEMRATLVTETCRLLGLANVRVDGHHAVIDGTRGGYSVHLGSATTKVLPGRVLLIVAVHSQHRGRLFLPFADDDPRTAEVLAKTLLLARDDEIKDPSILEQIRH
ncbi:MAG: DUF4132 domain-containing protein [Phycisphaerae bacterium]|nr:DUF4132 domain-containing protein [Phycisphaerae bacterium]